MFGLFGDKKAKLERKHGRLLEEAYKLSHTDRKASDLKHADAAEVLKQIEALERESVRSK